jgi:hypothetical protein
LNFLFFNWTPILIPLIIGLWKYRSFDKPFQILFFFVVFGSVNEVAGLILRSLVRVHNTMPQANLYFMVEFACLGFFYREIFRGRYHPSLFNWTILLFEGASIINLLFFSSIFEYPSELQAVSKIGLISFSLMYFYKVMDEAKIRNLWKEPAIYINVAVLIYYSGNLFFSVLFNLILEYSREFSKITTYYFSGLNGLFYLLIATGFWIKAKNQLIVRQG